MKAADVALRVALGVGLVLAASLGYAVYDSVANAPDVRAAEDVVPRYTPEPAPAPSQGTEPQHGADEPAPTEVSQPAPEPQTDQSRPPAAKPQSPAQPQPQPQAPQVTITVTPDAAAQQQYQRDLEAAEESQRLLQEKFAAEQEAFRREAERQEAAAREEQRRRAELQAAADAERFRAAVGECKRLVAGAIGGSGLGSAVQRAQADCERDPYGTVERFF